MRPIQTGLALLLALSSSAAMALGLGNIRVLSIGTLIGEAIARTAHEESVSSLFD